jgi:hypothetical protein
MLCNNNKKGNVMSYVTISNWTTSEWTDAMEAVARDVFIPMIMAAGASSTRMVRTGGQTMSVVTEYETAAKAEAAQVRIAEIRAKAAMDLPMSLVGAAGGDVFASN